MFLKLLRNSLIGFFFIPLFLYGQVEFLSVCDRTPQVRDAIMEKIIKVDPSIECDDEDLTPLLLSEIETLDLDSKNITSLKAGDFSGLSVLIYLDLRNNKIESLPVGTFSGLFALTHLHLSSNRIESLSTGNFSMLSALTHLYLHGNNLSSLVPGTFSGLSALTHLHLNRNRIESLVPGTFSELSALTKLDLGENQLSSLALGTFSGFSLKTLILSNNNIELLPGAFFSPNSNLRSLRYLSIEGNLLDRITKLRLEAWFQKDGRSWKNLRF